MPLGLIRTIALVQGAANAFPWVITPPAAMVLIVITVPAVALVARRRYRRRSTA